MMGMLSNGLRDRVLGGIMSEDELGRKMTLHRYRTNCPGSLATARKARENVKDWNARKTLMRY